MKTLVTGAAGFVGRAVVARLLQTRAAGDALVLADRSPLEVTGPDVEVRLGDLADSAFLARLIGGVTHVIHLAALPGGASEADYEQSRAVNLTASLELIERFASTDRPVRFVYASSIAVFGAPLPAIVDDDTPARPALTYGAHKLMVETALDNLTRLGRIEGLSLRLPGLVARPRGPNGLKSAFMSEIFHALAAHEPYTLPVAPDATVWILSAAAAARALLHGVAMEAPTEGRRRAINLPALRVTLADLAQTIAAGTGASPASIRYAPDEALEAQFGRLPVLSTPLAESLGFSHDGDLGALVRRVLTQLGGQSAS